MQRAVNLVSSSAAIASGAGLQPVLWDSTTGELVVKVSGAAVAGKQSFQARGNDGEALKTDYDYKYATAGASKAGLLGSAAKTATSSVASGFMSGIKKIGSLGQNISAVATGRMAERAAEKNARAAEKAAALGIAAAAKSKEAAAEAARIASLKALKNQSMTPTDKIRSRLNTLSAAAPKKPTMLGRMFGATGGATRRRRGRNAQATRHRRR
jgi:hypothetical protein